MSTWSIFSQLSDIEKELQEIHKKALSHIIATDLDTLIATVAEVRAEEEVLDKYLVEYKGQPDRGGCICV